MFCSVLFSALLASRVGRIMHDVPPTSSVFRHSYQVFLCSSGSCSYIIHPVNPRSFKSSCARPVHVLILSIQLILGLPFPRPPGTVPCMISFSKHDPSFLMMCALCKVFHFSFFYYPY